MFPAMSAWTDWCYGEPTMLLYDHKHVIESEAGVQQGDPLGPLYFCCGIMPLVNEINALPGVVYNKWYMDDGGIVADVPTLLKVWELIQARGPDLGLHLNPAKCEWSWLDPNRMDPCPIRLAGVSQAGQVKLVPHSEIQMLGVPLGSDSFVSGFVHKKLIGRLHTTIDQLVNFDDSQSAFYLLRVSFSIVRAVHFMRTTPLQQWKTQAVQFDGMLRKAAEDIFGFPFSDATYAQAALTPKLGGLGLRKTVEHADLAFAASWHEARRQSHEDWKQPPGVPDSAPAQKTASFAFDQKVLDYLIDSAPDSRTRQRLRRAAQPHASGFITAVPSEEDGNDTVLRPRNFQVSVAYRLGVPVLAEPIPCVFCKQTIEISGDHATCCRHSGDMIVRHNSVRNFVDRIASDALLSPVMEKKGILGDTSGRRPGDVTIPIWSSGKGMAIDVAVTSPLSASSVDVVTPCEEYAALKHKKYDEGFRGQPYFFSALVLETLGAINTEGEDLMRQLFRFAAKRVGREFSSFCGRGWARLSCNLQRSVSQMILSRIDGAPPALKSRVPALAPDLPPGSSSSSSPSSSSASSSSSSSTSSSFSYCTAFPSSSSPEPPRTPLPPAAPSALPPPATLPTATFSCSPPQGVSVSSFVPVLQFSPGAVPLHSVGELKRCLGQAVRIRRPLAAASATATGASDRTRATSPATAELPPRRFRSFLCLVCQEKEKKSKKRKKRSCCCPNPLRPLPRSPISFHPLPPPQNQSAPAPSLQLSEPRRSLSPQSTGSPRPITTLPKFPSPPR